MTHRDKTRQVDSGFVDPTGRLPKISYKFRQSSDINEVAEGRNVFTDSWIQQRLARIDPSIPITYAGAYEWQQSSEVEDGNPRYGYSFWGEPKPSYKAEYPYNHVAESESGHINEVDDTPGNERLNWQHRLGTYEEIDPEGNAVRKVVGNGYEIVCGDNYVYIKGRGAVTVDGSFHLLVLGESYTEILGDEHKMIRGNSYTHISGDQHTIVGGESVTMTKGDHRERVEGNRIQETLGISYSWTNGNAFDGVKGDRERITEGGLDEVINGDFTLNAIGQTEFYLHSDFLEAISGTMTLEAGGDFLLGASNTEIGGSQNLVLDSGTATQIHSGTEIDMASALINMNTNSPAPEPLSPSASFESYDSLGENMETVQQVPEGENDPPFVPNTVPRQEETLQNTPHSRTVPERGIEAFTNELFEDSEE